MKRPACPFNAGRITAEKIVSLNNFSDEMGIGQGLQAKISTKMSF
nr:hypothetical protein [uncultured Desulfobulbus sp.]